jgi:periplasmic protein CpxP/Spy
MKKLLLAIALGAISIMGSVSYAANGAGKMDERINHRVERMTQHLGLSEAQAAELTTVMRDQAEKRKALREEARAKVQTILNDEQRAKADKWREERKDRRQARRGKRHGKKGEQCGSTDKAAFLDAGPSKPMMI